MRQMHRSDFGGYRNESGHLDLYRIFTDYNDITHLTDTQRQVAHDFLDGIVAINPITSRQAAAIAVATAEAFVILARAVARNK